MVSAASTPTVAAWAQTSPQPLSKRSNQRLNEAEAAYQDINRTVMEFLPGVPLAHPTPSLAFNERVENYPASPVQDEVYNVVTLTAGR